MKHFLGSVGVRGFVRGPFFTRHPLVTCVFLCLRPNSNRVSPVTLLANDVI